MKKLLIIILILIAVFAAIPIAVTTKGNAPEENSISTSPTEAQKEPSGISTEDELIYAVSDSMQYIDSDTPKNVRQAVLDICRNNLKYYEENEIELPSVSITSYSDELYKKLTKEYENRRFSFKHGNKTVLIPLSKSGHLATATADEFPYLESVASPWEAYREDFKKTSEAPCGVSVYGLIFLSEKSDIRDALCYYLPGFEIEDKITPT